MKKHLLRFTTPLIAALVSAGALAQTIASKPATPTTERANAAVRAAMAMNDKQDFDDATRGKLAELSEAQIKAADGRVVLNTKAFDFIKGQAPASVNPSLWRQQELNAKAGFFKVADGIYQIRGYDLANMTLVETPNGWIVIDALFTAEMARAGMKLAMDTLKSNKPVVAVVYTHSHADHFGGVRGIVDEAALADALERGRLASAALDVFEGEPAVNPRLLALDTIVLTPHIASGSLATRRAMVALAVDNLIAALGAGPDAGRPPTPIRPAAIDGKDAKRPGTA